MSTLIGIVLRPEERYPAECLSKITHAISLVSSGAKVERRKLVRCPKRRSEGAPVFVTTLFNLFSSCLGSQEYLLAYQQARLLRCCHWVKVYNDMWITKV